MNNSRPRRALWGLFIWALCSWAAGTADFARAQSAEDNPRLSLPPSHLDDPFGLPVYLTGHFSFGGGFQNQPGDIGYGGSMVFSPGTTANIFSEFLGWDFTMVVQVDYLKIPDGGSILSGDLILRRYSGNRDDGMSDWNLFLGLGSGVSQIRLPDPDDGVPGDYWSIMGEAGTDWEIKPGFLFFLKGQYRWMINAGRTYGTWTGMAGLGVALPG